MCFVHRLLILEIFMHYSVKILIVVFIFLHLLNNWRHKRLSYIFNKYIRIGIVDCCGSKLNRFESIGVFWSKRLSIVLLKCRLTYPLINGCVRISCSVIKRYFFVSDAIFLLVQCFLKVSKLFLIFLFFKFHFIFPYLKIVHFFVQSTFLLCKSCFNFISLPINCKSRFFFSELFDFFQHFPSFFFLLCCHFLDSLMLLLG